MADLLRRAALDGHTALPLQVVLAAVGADALDDARSTGEVVADGTWVALESLATAESAVADELVGLALEERLAVVLGAVPSTAEVYVVADVHRRPLEEIAADLQGAPEDARVVVSGDPDATPGAPPGAVLRDLLAAGLAPVRDLRPEGADTSLERLPASVRAGTLPEPAADDRSVVVVVCPDDDVLARRVVQLVTDSIPRVFGIDSGQVLVLTPQNRGPAGIEQLTAALAGTRARVSVARDALPGTADAVVACFPALASGAITRAMVYDVARAARAHLSVVTAAGEALPLAVSSGVGPSRTTRLEALLRAGADELG